MRRSRSFEFVAHENFFSMQKAIKIKIFISFSGKSTSIIIIIVHSIQVIESYDVVRVEYKRITELKILRQFYIIFHSNEHFKCDDAQSSNEKRVNVAT